MSGLGILEHDPVPIVGLAADHSQTVVVLRIEVQIFLVNLRDLLHGHDPLAVDDGHPQSLFQILIDG